jgi:hypothetical protein
MSASRRILLGSCLLLATLLSTQVGSSRAARPDQQLDPDIAAFRGQGLLAFVANRLLLRLHRLEPVPGLVQTLTTRPFI